MKKAISIILTVVFLSAFFVGCETPSNDGAETTAPETDPVEDTSASFKDYASVIRLYRKVVDMSPNYADSKDDTCNSVFDIKNEAESEWLDRLFVSVETFYPKNTDGSFDAGGNHFGYAIKDINKDGAEELVLMLKDGEVLALFSTVNGSPILIDSFFPRYLCRIDDRGFIHIQASNSASNSVNTISQLSTEQKSLVVIEAFGTDGYNEESLNTVYYKMVDGKNVYISESEYTAFVESLPYTAFEDIVQTEVLSYIPLNTSESASAEELYNAVLAKEKAFYDVSEAKQVLLPDSFDEFAFIDLDGDKSKECVVRSLEEVLVLHYENGIIYGHSFTFRQISEIDTNGNCYWNDMTERGNEYGAYKLSFSEDTYELMSVFHIINDGEDNAEYYIGNKAATEAEITAFCDSLPEENVVWHKIA